jgi:hypothetical protein
MVSVLGQLIIFCPRPKNISARKMSEMLVSVLGQLIFFCAPRHSKVSVLCWIWSNTIMCLGLGQKNFDIIAKKLVSPYKIAASPILQTKCLVYFD